jgi:hypothetical protein
MDLTAEQDRLLKEPLRSKIFLHGPGGSGKTTAGTHWLKKLLNDHIPAHEIIVFVPQRALGQPYQDSLRETGDIAHSLINVMTLGGLARRMVELYWPMISHQAGFGKPLHPPHFLTMETAQYYMAHIIRPLIENEGFFSSLTINRNRIYSQILDNLNKTAIIGFPYQEIGERLKSAWVGDIEQMHIYDDVQSCVNQFRNFCLDNNLLDFSLQVEIFAKLLWPDAIVRDYLAKSYRHLIVDNLEEDTPVAHDILRDWIPSFDSSLLIFDENAGYRFFLGADVQSAYRLRNTCEKMIRFEDSLVSSTEITRIKQGVQNAVSRLVGEPPQYPEPVWEDISSALVIPEIRPKFFPAMIDRVAEQTQSLINEGASPGEIVILAPFMPDVLRFTLANRLDELGIPHRSHRPSRPLRDEPSAQAMLTLSRIAFPSWDILPKPINVSLALMQVIDGLDLIRSQILTDNIYRPGANNDVLRPFETVPAEIRERITYRVGARYDKLREWIAENASNEGLPLDFFMNRLFGEVLAQPGYGFHQDMGSGNIIATLIESIQKFRWAVDSPLTAYQFSIGKEYIQMVEDGVIAAQYIHNWADRDQNAVFVSPAYTFLIKNQPVDYQFWLDIGSPSWYQRLDQPLTQPYVLSRNWKKGKVWTADQELDAAHQTLNRLSVGLMNRCRKKIFLGLSELDVRGYENRGLLIRVLQQVLQKSRGINQ